MTAPVAFDLSTYVLSTYTAGACSCGWRGALYSARNGYYEAEKLASRDAAEHAAEATR